MPGLGLGIGLNRVIKSGNGFNAEYTAYLTRLQDLSYTLPSAPFQVATNRFITRFKTLGTTNQWGKVIRCWILCSETNQQTLVSLAFPESTICTDNATDFIASEGITGGGAKYRDTNFNGSTDGGSIWLEGDCGITTYCRTNSSTAFAATGVYTLSPLTFNSLYLGSPSEVNLNGDSGLGSAWTGFRSSGCTIALRSGTTEILYNNNIQVNTGTRSLTGMPNLPHHFPGRNGNGSNVDSDTRQYSIMIYHKGDIDTRVVTYACEELMTYLNKSTPLVSQIYLNGITNGQSFGASIYDFAGSGLDSTYTDPIPNTKSGNKAASDNPFVEALQNYQAGINGSISEGDGLHYSYNLFAAHKAHFDYGLYTCFTNTNVVGAGLHAMFGAESFSPTLVGSLWDAYKATWIAAIKKNNILAYNYHWFDQGQRDADDLTAANAYDVSLGTYCDAFRTLVGIPDLPIFIKGINVSGYYTYESIVRAKQIAYCAANANTIFVDAPYLVYDGTGHPTAASAVLEGEQQIDTVKEYFGL